MSNVQKTKKIPTHFNKLFLLPIKIVFSIPRFHYPNICGMSALVKTYNFDQNFIRHKNGFFFLMCTAISISMCTSLLYTLFWGGIKVFFCYYLTEKQGLSVLLLTIPCRFRGRPAPVIRQKPLRSG